MLLYMQFEVLQWHRNSPLSAAPLLYCERWSTCARGPARMLGDETCSLSGLRACGPRGPARMLGDAYDSRPQAVHDAGPTPAEVSCSLSGPRAWGARGPARMLGDMVQGRLPLEHFIA